MPQLEQLTDNEKRAFVQESLTIFHSRSLEPDDYSRILDLLKLTANKGTVSCARKWLRLFPEHDQAPRVVGRWLRAKPSNEVIYLAIHYLRTAPEARMLRSIVDAASRLPGHPKPLFRELAERLERDPSSDAWMYLQSTRPARKTTDKLLLRWFELNSENSDFAICIAAITFKSTSESVLEAGVSWLETTGRNSKSVELVLTGLLRCCGRVKTTLRNRIIECTRAWLRDNADRGWCGIVYRELLGSEASAVDAAEALDWYREHSHCEQSSAVLTGLLSATWRAQWEPDPYVIEQAKRQLRSEPEDKRSRGLMSALLKVQPDLEVFP